MCTFIVAWRVFDEAPVTVAANRDEQLDRPARPPALVESDPRVVAPLDEEAGGTWLGYNEHGVLVAVTNRWATTPPGERSRGLLVRDALRAESAVAARRVVEDALAADRYGPFHLVVADADDCVLLAYDGELVVREFDPGVHVVVNVGWDGEYVVPEHRATAGRLQAADADRLSDELEPDPGETAAEWTDRAAALLRDHEYGRCIHGDGYGTRSSSLVRLGPGGAAFDHAPGPPCRTPYERVAVSALPAEGEL